MIVNEVCGLSFSIMCCSYDALLSTAKDLIKGLLKTNPSERLTIDDILRHPWISVRYLYHEYSCLFCLSLSGVHEGPSNSFSVPYGTER